MKFDEHLKKERTGHLENISNMDYEFFFFCHLNWSILTLSQKWVKLLKYSGLYNRPLLAACIIGLQVILEAAFTIALLGVLLYK
jgi:hypothetical protein